MKESETERKKERKEITNLLEKGESRNSNLELQKPRLKKTALKSTESQPYGKIYLKMRPQTRV